MHQCTECNRSYQSGDELKCNSLFFPAFVHRSCAIAAGHMSQAHTHKRMFRCGICHVVQEFSTLFGLDRHLEQVHIKQISTDDIAVSLIPDELLTLPVRETGAREATTSNASQATTMTAFEDFSHLFGTDTYPEPAHTGEMFEYNTPAFSGAEDFPFDLSFGTGFRGSNLYDIFDGNSM
jgi:hypothetical protein